MADIEITADFKSILDADKASKRLEASFAELQGAVSRNASQTESLYAVWSKLSRAGLSLSDAQKSMARDAKMAADSAAKLERQHLKLNLANKSAADSARSMERAFAEQEKEARRLANANEALRVKYNDVYRNSEFFKKSIYELIQAKRIGALDADKYRAEVQKLKQEFREFGTQQATNANRFVQLAGAAKGNVRVQNDLGMATQQLGYQVGDFLVQVQSGTNVLVAFGQQATQLVGVLPLLSNSLKVSAGTLIAISTGLGIVIPLATALGAVFMRTRESSDSASKSVKSLSDRIDELAQSYRSLADARRAIEMGVSDEELFGIDTISMAQKELKAAKEELKEFEDLLSGGVSGATGQLQFVEQVKSLFGFDKGQQAEEAQKRVRLAQENLRFLQEELRLQEQRERDESVINQLHEARIILREQEKQQQKEAENSLNAQARYYHSLAAAQELLQRAAQKTYSDYAQLARQAEQRLQHEEKIRQEAGKQQAAYAQYYTSRVRGENDVESAAKETAKQLGISLDYARQLASIGFGNIWDGAAGAAKLASNLALAARMAANYEGRAASEEARVFNDRINDATAYGSTTGTGITVTDLETENFLPPKAEGTFGTFGAGAYPSGSSGGGGGGAAKEVETFESLFKEIQKTVEEAEALVGVFGYKRDAIQEIIRMEEELQRTLTDTEKLKVENAFKERERAEQEQQRIEAFSAIIENGFMDLITGAKSVEDAFKGMIREILLEVYRQQIAKPAANALGSIVGKFLSFDGGGYTGNGPRSGGLDGRGGMLAMVHPKETVVDHSKGQDMGTTIIQNFNFSANGDESVKRIIAQEAPKIAQYTTREIVKQRRQGGNMKAVFRG